MSTFEASDQVNSALVSIAASSTQLAIARNSRRQITVLNTDASASAHINVDAAAVVANHFKLIPGASITIRTKGELRAISSSGTIVLAIWDEFD